MSEDLEFHYVVSYREGVGWSIASDTEDAAFPSGTIYDWETDTWVFPSGLDAGEDVEQTDLEHYSDLKDALELLNKQKPL
jgi:hypothetical protein